MAGKNPAMIGSIIERKPASPSPPTLNRHPSEGTGFPSAQHRSKSAFARNRESAFKTDHSRPREVPKLITQNSTPKTVQNENWRDQVSRENELRVQNMTEEEREREKQEIMDRFGPDIADILKRARSTREKQAVALPDSSNKDLEALDEVPITSPDRSNGETSPKRLSSPPALSTASTRPSSRTDRRLRFAELSPADVHVYESAPPSPRRKPLALPPPTHDGSAISLGQWKGSNIRAPRLAEPRMERPEPEEGSPEYIRRRYFPDALKDNPDLAWMNQSPSSSDSDVTSLLRFDLSGRPIPLTVSASLPTHLGLHHHAEGTHAGYTLDDIFLLSRSTVPAQRATMLSVLARIARRLSAMSRGIEVDGTQELKGKEEALRKRIVSAGVEAMSERGSVGARAIEVVWQCIVGWDEGHSRFEGVELELPTDVALKSLQLEYFLPPTAALLRQGHLSQESRSQVLGILTRLAQQSNDYAEQITKTPQLISTFIQTFLLTPLSPSDDASPPDPLAIDVLTILVTASRANGLALKEYAGTTLRFLAMLPTSSIYSVPLATSLLVSTLRFYKALAYYGLSVHVASTAMAEFTKLGQYILSDACKSRALMVAWLDLLESWMICAVDPHQTTPEHGILWSQIIAWRWDEEANNVRDRLGTDEDDWQVLASVWKVNAAWLEGSRINGIRGGAAERLEGAEIYRRGFEDGTDGMVVASCLDALKQELLNVGTTPLTRSHLPHIRALGRHANILAFAMRLWLSCLLPVIDGAPTPPPFSLPFSHISGLCAKIIVHPVWSLLSSADSSMAQAYVHLRPLSYLLSMFIRLSQRLPGISKALWSAQALAVFAKLLPGDEGFALQVLGDFSDILTSDWVVSLSIQVPSAVWDKGVMEIIRPFLTHTIRPRSDTTIGPFIPTPDSILLSTTQRLPSRSSIRDWGLPLSRDWTITPIDHLLRSSSSEVFKSLPSPWNASEIDITCASLTLTLVVRDILAHFNLLDFVLSREEAVFGCMKIFMLEHDQPHTDSTEEVFRDQIVEQLMGDLLKPYTFSTANSFSDPHPVVPTSSVGDLEQVAARFLGQTPFFQYYTDFVSLYDAISFSHPLFARLLLPPTSMRYAIDYRKHLWNDFGHVVKTIRTSTEQVLSADIREYLWPLEGDPQVLGSYLRSLLKDRSQGFVYLVALHHVASSIWSRDEEGWSEDPASKLLQAIVGQGTLETVRAVVLYQQTKSRSILQPPLCFDGLSKEEKAFRLECTIRWGLGEHVRKLLDD